MGEKFKRKDVGPCAMCNKGLMHDQNMIFMRVGIEYMVMDLGAIQRAHGLEQFFGGTPEAAMIANVMSPDEDLAKCSTDHQGMLVCGNCMDQTTLYKLFEKVCEEADADEEE